MMAGSTAEKDSTNFPINTKGNGLLLYYHHYSFYSQKVVMALHEKKLPFKSRIVNIRKGEQFEPWFLQINPKGEVPVLQDGVKIIPDSGRILDYLEDNFSNGDTPRLIPLDQGVELKQKVMHFRSLIEQVPAGVITMGSFFHPEFRKSPRLPFIQPVRRMMQSAEENRTATLRYHAEKNPEHRNVLLQKAESQERKQSTLIDQAEFKKVLDQVDSILGEIEQELASHVNDKVEWWLCAAQFTVADICLTILMDRISRLGLEHHFWGAEKNPFLKKYYLRVQQRDSYNKTIPSSLVLVKMLVNTQSPIVVGVGVVAVVAVVVGVIYLFKKAP